ncbi:MAG: AraC family transcriptional regulator [Planctomycetota bacterium]
MSRLRDGIAAAPATTEAPAAALCCRYLFHQGQDPVPRVDRALHLHDHPFWQLELIAGPGIALHLPPRELACPVGAAVLIPPGVTHAFGYTDPRGAFLSFRFTMNGHPGLRDVRIATAADRLRGGLATAIQACVERRHRLDPARRAMAEHLLAALVWHLAPLSPPEHRRIDDPLVREVVERLEQRGGRRIAVGALAAQLGYSRSRLATRFRTAMGVSLKSYCDECCAAAAERLLTYSDHSVGAIAAALGFGDQFVFSRFFSRLRSCSPRAFRDRPRLETSDADTL